MDKLKVCPFCGGEAQLYEPDYPAAIGERYAIICTECGASTHTIFQQKGEAIRAWNRRTQLENKPLSNFDHITESPQMLAEFVQGLMQGANCKNCPGTDCLNVGCLKSFERWLNKPGQEGK